MLKKTAFVIAALGVASGALADSAVELDVALGQNDRGGNGMNSSGAPLVEAEHYQIGSIHLRSGWALDSGTNLSLSFGHIAGNAGDITDGGTTNDTMASATTAALQVHRTVGQSTLGGFLALGTTKFTEDDIDQNTDFRVFGASISRQLGSAGATLQLGRMSGDALNGETLDDVTFVAGTLTFDLNAQSSLTLSAAVANGTQDFDSAGPDPMRTTNFGIEYSRDVTFGGQSAIVYTSANVIKSSERPSSATPTVTNDRILQIGVRIPLGQNAGSATDRRALLGPRLPNFGLWQGAAPAAD